MSTGSLLVVEDDALVSWAFEKAAAAVRVPVRVAASGAEALAALREERCRLAIVDIRLPDADGIDLMPEMAALSPDMRFVVVTADASAANRERAFDRGAWQFIEKPFEMAEVRRVIAECFAEPAVRHRDERRLHERRRCSLPVRLDVLVASGGGGAPPRVLDGTAVEVSHGGLRLETRHPLEPGQELRVRPVRDAAAPEASFRDGVARVVWTRRAGETFVAGLAYLAR